MKKIKKIAALFLCLAMILALAACGGGAQSGTSSGSTPGASSGGPAAGGTTLTVGVMNDTDGFDPINTVNFVGINLVYEGLFDIDPDTSEIYGVLAESWGCQQ